MRFCWKNLALAPLVATLAGPMLITGCKTQTTTEVVKQEPSDYAQWEQTTHRQHVALERRNAEEQKEYRDWHVRH